MTEEWLDFIVECRSGKSNSYDIVEGPMADDFIVRNNITNGEYDNISKCKYAVPDYWDIGEVFERLIEDSYEEEDVISGMIEVYNSWLAEKILNFNSDLYYQSREYIAACFKEGKLLEVGFV